MKVRDLVEKGNGKIRFKVIEEWSLDDIDEVDIDKVNKMHILSPGLAQFRGHYMDSIKEELLDKEVVEYDVLNSSMIVIIVEKENVGIDDSASDIDDSEEPKEDETNQGNQKNEDDKTDDIENDLKE